MKNPTQAHSQTNVLSVSGPNEPVGCSAARRLTLDEMEMTVGGFSLRGAWDSVSASAGNAWSVTSALGTGVATGIMGNGRPGESMSFTPGLAPSHDYVVRTPIPDNISNEAAQYGLNTRHAPVEGGGPTHEDRDMLQGVISGNPVSYERPDPNTVINVTEPGHILYQGGDAQHRGQVENRIVTDENGQRFFESHGTAAATAPSMSDFQQHPFSTTGQVAFSNIQQAINTPGGFGLFRNQQQQMLQAARDRQDGMDRANGENVGSVLEQEQQQQQQDGLVRANGENVGSVLEQDREGNGTGNAGNEFPPAQDFGTDPVGVDANGSSFDETGFASGGATNDGEFPPAQDFGTDPVGVDANGSSFDESGFTGDSGEGSVEE